MIALLLMIKRVAKLRTIFKDTEKYTFNIQKTTLALKGSKNEKHGTAHNRNYELCRVIEPRKAV